jgi:hypothetical protein
MPPGDDSSRLDELHARVEELERRLSALEHLPQRQSPHPESAAAPAFASAGPVEAASGESQQNLFPIVGRAVLGIAGAYLLRAAAEAGILASWLAVTLALAYAAAWLVWAAWPEGQTLLARHSYAITAALILLFSAGSSFLLGERPGAET